MKGSDRRTTDREEGMDITVTSIMGGPDIGLVPHWLAHYRGLGLDRFVVVVNDPVRAEDYGRCLAAEGVEPAYYLDELFYKDEINERTRLCEATKSQWILQADLDELVVFDRHLEVLLEDCVAGGYPVVPGRCIDHLQDEGHLVEVQAEPSLWQQFPIMHPITNYVRSGDTTKMVLRQRYFPVTSGNHVDESCMTDCYPAWQEVHHFRWTAATVPSMKHTLEVWPDCTCRYQLQNVLNFLGDPPRLDLDRLRELAPFLDSSQTLLEKWLEGQGIVKGGGCF